MLGEESVHHYQQILQEHWGSGDTAVLPGDDVQCLLLGVRTILSIWVSGSLDNCSLITQNSLLLFSG